MRVKNLDFADGRASVLVDNQEYDVSSIVNIDPNNLLEELARQPGLFSYWQRLLQNVGVDTKQQREILRGLELKQ